MNEIEDEYKNLGEMMENITDIYLNYDKIPLLYLFGCIMKEKEREKLY